MLAVMALEAVLLVVLRRRRPDEALALVLPGALILLALRGALVGAAWPWIALPLLLSLPAHLADLRLRGWLGGRRR